jgi:pimeloyl-ACP methyl ester carboxylesterase
MKVLDTIVLVVLAPIGFAFFLVFVVLWMIWTLTGVGPLYQWYSACRDKDMLDTIRITNRDLSFRIISIPGEIHSCSMGKPYKLFAVFSTPETESCFPPVCIPNGLGANAVLISKLQEALVAAGFTVLSFDRFGVGLSDENVSGSFPTASDVVAEMEYVMSAVLPGEQKWILLGPSMGSIVAQCYIAQHPHKIVGFLNMDGLPYPFIQQKSAFAWAGFIYKMYAAIVWTGILRPCIGMASKDIERMFGSRSFSLWLILALINQRRFFGNIALEMSTMMDCCAMAERAWGPQSLLKLPPWELEVQPPLTQDALQDFRDFLRHFSVTYRGRYWFAPLRTKASASLPAAPTALCLHHCPPLWRCAPPRRSAVPRSAGPTGALLRRCVRRWQQ